jgi:hypothetical protein
MSLLRKTSLLVLWIFLLAGVFFVTQSVAQLGKLEAYKPDARSYKKIAEPKYRPINPPVDVMVNPLTKPVREGDLCDTE